MRGSTVPKGDQASKLIRLLGTDWSEVFLVWKEYDGDLLDYSALVVPQSINPSVNHGIFKKDRRFIRDSKQTHYNVAELIWIRYVNPGFQPLRFLRRPPRNSPLLWKAEISHECQQGLCCKSLAVNATLQHQLERQMTRTITRNSTSVIACSGKSVQK